MRAQLFTCYTDCRPFLVDTTTNFCKLNGKSSSYFLNMIYKAFKSYPTNIIPGECPYPQGAYYVRNISSNVNLFQLFPIPDNTYLVSFKFYEDVKKAKVLILSLKFKVRIYHEDEKKTKSVKKGKLGFVAEQDQNV